ncbi:uncharacterized protein LOC112589660 [Harpegnathos saltator]|uniref:uncharacterized protein LOC112589660 n=1 Tax=Harpegnathos saltator TaxID=610380 RepID=UPI000DBEE192|nr:uncharacterized protein LOC112589660 [Harpegnathos saltator]
MEHGNPSTSKIEGSYKKRKIKAFKQSWLENEKFKDWLILHSDGTRAYCTACGKILACGKSELIKHAVRKIHISNISRQKLDKISNNTSGNLFNKLVNDKPVSSFTTESVDYVEKVKLAENKLATFYAEYDVALDSLNHMVFLLQDLCIQPQIINDLTLSRRKCTQIIKNVIASDGIEYEVGQCE